MNKRNLLLALASLGLGAASIFALRPVPADAADHTEAPGTTADQVADLTDFYAWHTADSLVTALDFGPFLTAGGAPLYDKNVNYVIHIDNDGDLSNGSEIDIDVRFGRNDANGWGVRATGLPGAAYPLVGAVNTVITDGDYSLFAGLRDDPFFFDLAGFQSTLNVANSDASLDFSALSGAPVDAFAGFNVMSIVLEFPSAAAADGATTIYAWATSGRAPAPK